MHRHLDDGHGAELELRRTEARQHLRTSGDAVPVGDGIRFRRHRHD
jgi:hypothetical protein